MNDSSKDILTNSFYWILSGIIILLFIASYHTTLVWMHQRYMSADSYYSHGYLIPLISAYLIWTQKDAIKETTMSSSYLGLVIIIFGALIHILGTILYVFSLSGFSIFFIILGSSLFIFGKKITKIIIFPIVYLLFMFPVPLAVILAVSFPMKMIVAHAGVEIVSLFGIPLYREGFHISIPAGQLLVANPCSGLRSLIAFMALGAVIANYSKENWIKKIILFLSSIPIAIFSNVVRVSGLILISHFWGLDAAAPDSIWHTITGVFVFVIGFILLYFINRMLRWKTSEIVVLS